MTRGKGIIVLILLVDLVISHRTVSPFSSITKRSFTENVRSEVTLVASPSSLTTAGWIEVQFSGVSEPNSQDWIGIYSPPTVDVTKTAPVRYQLAYVAAGYNSTGSGTLNFRLINIRDDYVFVFFKVTGNQQVAIGKSNIVSFKDYNQPLYGHISIGDSPSQMKVTWVSKQISNPMVQYGTSSENYSNNVTASSTTFKSTDLCGSPATDFGYRDPGFIHTAVLDNLVAGQQYFYIYGDSFGMSAEASFVAPPTPSPTQGVNLIAYGDMGKASVDGSLEHWEEFPSLNTTANVISKLNEIDLVLHIGDISYAVGYEAQWDQFFEQVEPVASVKPYMTCIGNHERDFPNSGSFYNGTDSGGECGVPYETYLPMPTPAVDQPWYSFDYGNIHFLLMSTEHDFQNTSEQYQFIVNDLQQVQRSKTPWVIFAGHRPMYIDSTNNNPPDGDEPVAKLLRLHLEPVLLKYGVDMALWGHHHSYQRTCPVFQEECQDYGIVHVVIGMAGMGLSQNLEQTPPSWIEYVDDDNYGYSQIQTTENTLEMWYYSNTEGLKDNFIISKK